MKDAKIVLGINAYHADSSACLLINGNLVAAVEEERINRKKHYSGYPIEAIKECLKIGNIKETDITDLAFNTNPYSNFLKKSFFYLKNLSLRKDSQISSFNKKRNLDKISKDKLKLNKNVKFHFIEHHLAHIASAYYPSMFKKANGLSIDGSGDFVSMAIAECENNKIMIKKKIFFPDSLGIFYHAMTQFLGYKNYGDEYKIMGLAAYGKPIYYEKIINNLFKVNSSQKFELNLNFFNHYKKNFRYIANEDLVIDKIFNSKIKKLFSEEMNEDDFDKNFASSVQKIYEFYFKKIIDEVAAKKYSQNIVFSGGCALNSSANRFLTFGHNFFKKIFINCAPGDNGGALGASFVVAANSSGILKNTSSPYLGNSFSDNYIKNILDTETYKDKLNYEFISDTDKFTQTTAKFISEGNVIGWFQDKMEFGPRALGNRSILADPRNPEMKNIINQKIKRRESFRPFAPAVLQEFQNEWFEDNFYNPYMSSLSKVKKEKRSIIPAVTHFDNTARIQTVNLENNKKFYDLLNHFHKISGVPILLNTSFNENEPIVMKPEEALDCILRTDIDAIFINNFIVKKIKY